MPTKLIVYSKGNVIFDTSRTQQTRKVRLRENKHKKDIKYTIFEDMKNIDPLKNNIFWNEILSNASTGTFRHNYSFDSIKNKLKYKSNIKNKNDEVFLNAETPEENFEILRNFLKDRGITEDDEEFDVGISDDTKVESADWKQNGKIHPSVLYIYIQKMKKKHNLNEVECRRLESKVRIGIVSDSFNTKNIIIEDNLISSIKDLEFEPKKRDFEILSKPKITKPKSVKVEKNEYSISTLSGVINVEVDKKNINIGKIWFNYLQNKVKKEIYI